MNRDNSSEATIDDPFAQSDRVEAAIEDAGSYMHEEDILDDENPRDRDSVSAFIENALDVAPYANWHGAPEVKFDLPDDSLWASFCSHKKRTVHLHPRLTGQWILIPLAAAWSTPAATAHGPRYCRVLTTLTRTLLGDDAVEILTQSFANHCVAVLADERLTPQPRTAERTLTPRECAFFPYPQEAEYGMLLCTDKDNNRWTALGDPALVRMMLDLDEEHLPELRSIGGAWEQRPGWPDEWDSW